MSALIDLDHAATTPVRPEVVAAMEPFASLEYGNPSGSHRLARTAVRALDEARERCAAVLGCLPGGVVFTSGGTESDNQAVAGGMPPRPGTPVCS
ncbi:MAG: aminotransferase class V-fold PLP-dependent enzyme, partial [Actinomycetes bacterium]